MERTEDKRNNDKEMEDEVGTPMNLSALDEVGQASRRNPIDTDCSQQQQDDLRNSQLD